jgi:hypothetical protein
MTWKTVDDVRDQYIGQFDCGYMHGQGTYTYANGGRYQGQFFRSQRSGYGVFTFPSGALYDGKWQRDVPEGDGRVIYPTGEIVSTTFSNGEQDFQEDEWKLNARGAAEKRAREEDSVARLIVRQAMDAAKEDPEKMKITLQKIEAEQQAKALVPPPPPPPPLADRPPPGSGIVAVQTKGIPSIASLPALPSLAALPSGPGGPGGCSMAQLSSMGGHLVSSTNDRSGSDAFSSSRANPPLPTMARIGPPPPPLEQRGISFSERLAIADATSPKRR